MSEQSRTEAGIFRQQRLKPELERLKLMSESESCAVLIAHTVTPGLASL
jgi:hypothetical protein